MLAARMSELQRALKAKSRDVADQSLQRHLALLKESQLKVELEKLRRSGKFNVSEKKADELERQTRLVHSYDFQIASLADEALDLYRQTTESEAEGLDAQIHGLRSELRQAMESTGEIHRDTDALARQIEAMTSTWLQKKSEVSQLQDKESELSRAWREKFIGVQLK